MLLATANAQSELSPFERGMHALNRGMDVKAYAASVGWSRVTVQREVMAARVAQAVFHMEHGELSEHHRNLVEIHAAPAWLWPALVKEMLAKGWTVEQAREQAGRFKELPDEAPACMAPSVPDDLVAGKMRAVDVGRISKVLDDADEERRKLNAEIVNLLKKVSLLDRKPERRASGNCRLERCRRSWRHSRPRSQPFTRATPTPRRPAKICWRRCANFVEKVGVAWGAKS